MNGKPEERPSEVNAEDGEVLVDGPDGVAVSMTPDAAEETSHRLLLGAMKAQGQAHADKRAGKRRDASGR